MTKKTENPAACKQTGTIDNITVVPRSNEFFDELVQRAAGLQIIEARS